MDYRFKEDNLVIRFPEGYEEEDRGLKECCNCTFLVLADPSDNASYKNDIELAYLKKGSPTDVVTFTIEDCNGTILSNLGIVADFPQDDSAEGFMFDWQQYLNTYGAGIYIIRVNFTIAGITGGYPWGAFELKPFSIATAQGSFRLYSKFDSYFLKEEIDFSNSNCETTLRVRGFFGNRQPKTEIAQLIDKGRKVVKTTRENLNEYEFRTDPISECYTRRIIDFHLLNEDSLFISDHNKTNHSYQYFDLPVVLNESPEVEYREKNRWASITALFGDRTKLDKSYYNKQ